MVCSTGLASVPSVRGAFSLRQRGLSSLDIHIIARDTQKVNGDCSENFVIASEGTRV